MKIPDRKRNRLAGYDYSRDGLYFVTICVHNRTEWFGRVADGVVVLNDIGRIADEQWRWLGQQYPYVDLGPYVIMPNHIHALIRANNPVGNGRDRSAGNARRVAPSDHVGLIDTHDGACGPGPVATGPYRRKSLSGLVGAFKTTSSKAIHLAGHGQFRWQKSFHDSIVGNERSLARITQYIHGNPAQWATDSENPESNISMHLTGASRPPEDGRPRCPVR